MNLKLVKKSKWGDKVKENIGVIGGGSWGTALALLLNKNGHEVDMWIRNDNDIKNIVDYKEHKRYLPGIKLPDSLTISSDVSKIIRNKKILVLAVPSHAIRNTLNEKKSS